VTDECGVQSLVAAAERRRQLAIMNRPDNEYVLGTHDAELVRLGLQHRLWSRQAFDLWERAGIGPGARVLDVGCGPGHATFDLAQLVTHGGRVVAVDESERFIRYLTAQAEVRGVINVDASVQDVQTLRVPEESVDFAYARWVLCFTPRPDNVVAGVARALKPGGCLLVQDYTQWQGLFLSPPSEAFLEVLRATDRAWRESGGDSEVGKRLPAMMASHGLRVESIRPLQRIARPREPLWQWPASFFANWAPSLVERGYLSADAQKAFVREWEARSSDRDAFFWTPAMLEIIARRL
jgi:SAM-dependent methyltransferase